MELDEEDFIHWFHRALAAHYKQSEEPCMGTSKYSWFMPISAVHMCLEYLINSTDVAPRLLGGGGIDGWREAGRERERRLKMVEREVHIEKNRTGWKK